MEKDIPLKIETLSGEESDKYLITSAKEIELILHTLIEKCTRVALYYGNADEFLLITLLDIDNKGLWLEQSPNGHGSRQVVASNHLVFVSSHQQVKVQFTTHQASSVIHDGHPAFYIALPKSLYRFQRRDYYRISIPVSVPLRCIIPAGDVPSKKPHEVTIMDISGGGVGLTCEETGVELVPGNVYANCTINLPDVGTIISTIEVRNLKVVTTSSGRTYNQAGCVFKNLNNQSIILLQRYVTNMQRAKVETE